MTTNSTYPTSKAFFLVPKGRVAVAPFPASSNTEVKNGVLQPMNQSALTRLEIVFPSFVGEDVVDAGDFAHVRSRLAHTTTYAKEVLEVNGRKFLLLPTEEILVLEHVQ